MHGACHTSPMLCIAEGLLYKEEESLLLAVLISGKVLLETSAHDSRR